ncbi:GntR family transcriptional regulator [Qipengyuania sp. DSG2-2]|uniref:GntR family transcriptional regulator n=1 Tax=Qipengyuania sp. DGS2-2 TaxID=3349631 RepID=UPI0036D2B855
MSTNSRPVYLKLRDLIAASIIEGRYREGEMLPSVRSFAADQGANPLTVAKAYQQFQADGLVAVQRGVGMYVVRGAAAKLRDAERERFLAEEWPDIAERMARLDIDPKSLSMPQTNAGTSPGSGAKKAEAASA